METALAKSNADLQFLRTQINPHFLFNALNTLYGTALKENAEHTAEGIQKLGDMMRFMLYENNLDFIPMDKEIEYLKKLYSERLFFKRPLRKLKITASADQPLYGQRKQVKIDVSAVTEEGKLIPANMSMAVFRVDSRAAENEQDISNYLLLCADLPGKIESPGYYFPGK
ncbi:MAG: histidine kinase [Ferruginibacter sp.]